MRVRTSADGGRRSSRPGLARSGSPRGGVIFRTSGFSPDSRLLPSICGVCRSRGLRKGVLEMLRLTTLAPRRRASPKTRGRPAAWDEPPDARLPWKAGVSRPASAIWNGLRASSASMPSGCSKRWATAWSRTVSPPIGSEIARLLDDDPSFSCRAISRETGYSDWTGPQDRART